jgi:predicted nucleotidyltransferase
MAGVQIELPRAGLAAFARRWRITEIALFGSAVRDDFRPDSDVDVLVTFDPDAHHGLFALARMQNELSELVGRPVDLIPIDAVLQSENRRRRERILSSASVVYAA